MRLSTGRTLPLSEAARRYPPSALRTRAQRELASPPAPAILPDLDYGPHRQKIEAFSGILDAVSRLTFQLTDRTAPSPDMKRWLIQKLSEGRLQAVGMKMLPRPASRPENIPSFIFKGTPRINWRTSTIENFGRTFDAVEVSRAMPGQARTARPSSARGRPTKEIEIKRAINGLKRGGVDVAKMPRKAAIAAIIDYARDEIGANVQLGYSKPVLQRVLLRRYGKRC